MKQCWHTVLVLHCLCFKKEKNTTTFSIDWGRCAVHLHRSTFVLSVGVGGGEVFVWGFVDNDWEVFLTLKTTQFSMLLVLHKAFTKPAVETWACRLLRCVQVTQQLLTSYDTMQLRGKGVLWQSENTFYYRHHWMVIRVARTLTNAPFLTATTVDPSIIYSSTNSTPCWVAAQHAREHSRQKVSAIPCHFTQQ